MGKRRDLRDEIDELFGDLWQISRMSGRRRGFRPQVDSFRTDDPPVFTVIVEIAGIDPDLVKVTATEGSSISGERRRQPCEVPSSSRSRSSTARSNGSSVCPKRSTLCTPRLTTSAAC